MMYNNQTWQGLRTSFRLAVLAIAYIALAETALADPVTIGAPSRGYTYFNRPGADLAAHNSELLECLSTASLVVSEDVRAFPQSTGILPPLIAAAMTQGTGPAAIENCMVVRGWRVVRLPDTEGESLSLLDPDTLADQLRSWVGSGEPGGEIVRVWGNDAVRASTDRYELRPATTPRGSLSVDMLGNQEVARADHAPSSHVTLDQLPQAVQPRALTHLPSGYAALVVFLRNASPRNGVGISFERVSTGDGANSLLAWSHGFSRSNALGVWRAFIVPAGRWRISGLHSISLCLGSPGFEVGAGEVVYAGAFDLGAESVGPDLDLAGVKSWLAAEPSLVNQIHAAQYTNGWTGTCGGSSIYALEIPGAPFREGYSWGGASRF